MALQAFDKLHDLPGTDPAVSPLQCAKMLAMIRPANFEFDPETADSNPHQHQIPGLTPSDLNAIGKQEFDLAVQTLRAQGVSVSVIDDPVETYTPNAVFPNNWFSTHADGTVVYYPMLKKNRRLERRPEAIDQIARSLRLRIDKVVDLSYLENEGEILEGTGSLVLDRKNRIAYAGLSQRTTEGAARIFAEKIGYKLVLFETKDSNKEPVYHTNVLMSVGEQTAVLCKEAISNRKDRSRISGLLRETGHNIVTITGQQMADFAGNCLELKNRQGEKLWTMSSRAKGSLTPAQIEAIEGEHDRIVDFPIPMIEEVGGGSARCMQAEIHLPKIR